MTLTLVDKLRIHLPKAIKLFPGGIADGIGSYRIDQNEINNNRLESLTLLFLYLNKCLLEIMDGKENSGESIQEALECFDAFMSLFITIESELLLAFLQSDLRSFSTVTNLAVQIFVKADRLYFTDSLVSILSYFTARMNLFSEGGVENLILCDKIYYGLLKSISSICISSSSVARTVLELYRVFLDLCPKAANQNPSVKKCDKPLKLFSSPQTFLKIPVSGLFQIPFFFPGVNTVASNGLRKASQILQSTCQSNTDDELLSLFCEECSRTLLVEFSANELWTKLPEDALSKFPHIFKQYVLPLVLLYASRPSNNLECKSFIRMTRDPNLLQTSYQLLLEISSKRDWSFSKSVASLTLPNLRRFALFTLTDSFSFDSTTFLVSLLHNEDFSSRMDICKCLAQVCVSHALKGCVHYLDDHALDCFRVPECNLEYVHSFFERILRYTESGFALTLVEQESLGIWAFAITKHLTTCHLLAHHPLSHQSISSCITHLLLLCQKGGSVGKMSAAFFIVWGVVLGSGALEDGVMDRRLWSQNGLSLQENSPFSLVSVPPCSASILDLCFELLLNLRNCEYLDIRVRVLNLCKLLTGNIQESRKVMKTDYITLVTVYCVVLGSESLYFSKYRPFDKMEQCPEILNLVESILEFGHRVHFITFQPAVFNRSTMVLSSSMTSTEKERTRRLSWTHGKNDLFPGMRSSIRPSNDKYQFLPTHDSKDAADHVNEIDRMKNSVESEPLERAIKMSHHSLGLSNDESHSTFSIPTISDESPSTDPLECRKKTSVTQTTEKLEKSTKSSELESIRNGNEYASATSHAQSFIMPLDFRSMAIETGISNAEMIAQHEPQSVKSAKTVDEVMRLGELAETQNSLVDEFLATKTFGEEDISRVNSFSDDKENTKPKSAWMSKDADETAKEKYDLAVDEPTPQLLNEPLVIQQSASVKLPFAKASIVKAVPLVIRHLIFSRNVKNKFSYFDIYSDGLLSGPLQFANFTLERAFQTMAMVPLHPRIRDVVTLDMHLLLELVQDFEMLNVTDEDTLFLWVSGLNDLHRHFLPLSRSFHTAESELKRELSVAECLVIVRDKIAVVKLSTNTLTAANLEKIEASTQNLLGLESGLDQGSRILGSMILIEDTFTKWLSFLLDLTPQFTQK